MIIPCPPECLKSCIYPNNVPCPHLYPPKCPSEVPAPPAVLTIPATDKDKGEPSALIYEQLSTKVQALIDGQNKLIHDAQGVLHDEESLLELIKQQQKEQQQPAMPTERHGEENDAANGDDAQPPVPHPHAQQPEYSQTRPSIPVPPLKPVANANSQVAPASSIANSKDTTPLQACPKIYIPW
ncbi:hypothetical protein BC940DRAFT_295381 [Gongronella butleri]|nr:hypothetical protein BC940DRAFT_295381 [Gongronella butleri]